MNTEKLLIVNADDLGYSAHVNESIFQLMEQGEITSGTLLVNAPGFEEAAKQQRHFSNCSFGVHLNCTEFSPLSRHKGLYPLLSDDGCFTVSPRQARPSPQLLAGVFSEWSAQIERAIACGVRISHLDSHHHTHTCVPLFPVLKALQTKYGIRVVRKSINIYAARFQISKKLLYSKHIWNTALVRIVATKVTDVFLELETLMEAPTRETWDFKTAEVMTHPGAREDVDTPILKSDWKSKLPFPVRLVSYHDLVKAA